jgi:hypothetical protein
MPRIAASEGDAYYEARRSELGIEKPYEEDAPGKESSPC